MSNNTDLIDIKYTRITPVTRGPVFEISYFSLGSTFNNIVSNMKDLFDFPYILSGNNYEDITFYNEERVIMAVCSHEQFADMYLTHEEYIEVKKLGI